MCILWTLCLLFLIAFLCYEYLTGNFGIWKKLGLNGPKPRIIYGNFPSIITGQRSIVYDVDEVYSSYKNSNRAIGVFMTRNPEILLLDPKLAHELLVTNFSKFRDNLSNTYVLNKGYDKYAARNPFFIAGPLWKGKRADIIAGLAVSRLSAAYPIWKGSALRLRNYLESKTSFTNMAIIDVKDIASRFTIDILSDFLWGIESRAFDFEEPEEIQLLEMCKKMMQQAANAEGLNSNLNLMPFLTVLFPRSRVFPIETDNFFSSLTKLALKMRSTDHNNVERTDFLNHIMNLQERKHISHDDVMGHMLTVVLDGYETAAIAIYHTLFYLAKYTRAQDKLRDEIRKNLHEANNEFMSFEDLNGLPYLDQCVYETLRMISPLPKISRICTEATELKIDEATRIPIQPGMVVTIPVFSYHHDAEYFPYPYKYNPERFDHSRHVDLTKQGILLPFGDGPRICLGLRLALLEIKACIVEILKGYRLECTTHTVQEKKPDSRSFIFGLEGDFSLCFERLDY